MLQKFCNGLHLVWFGLVLYLWHSKGRYHFNYDTMAASLTMLEITLVVGGLASFTYFKYIAESKSEKVAQTTVDDFIEQRMESLVAREVRANLATVNITGNEKIEDDELEKLVSALAEQGHEENGS